MVYFQCETCISTLKKNQIEKHFSFQCRQSHEFSCLTCFKFFDRQSFKEHTSCVTEDEKYKHGDSEFLLRNKKQNKPANVLNRTVDLEGIKWSGMRKTTKEVLKKTAKRNLKFIDLKNYLVNILANSKGVDKDDVDLIYFDSSLKDKLALEKQIVINKDVVFYV